MDPWERARRYRELAEACLQKSRTAASSKGRERFNQLSEEFTGLADKEEGVVLASSPHLERRQNPRSRS